MQNWVELYRKLEQLIQDVEKGIVRTMDYNAVKISHHI